MKHPSLLSGVHLRLRALALVVLAFSITTAIPPAIAQTRPGGTTVYRLEPGSSYQRGCLDPEYCQVPEPIALTGTFVLTGHLAYYPFTDLYQITDVSWRAASGTNPFIWGSGRFIIGENFEYGMRLSLEGGNLSDVPLWGSVLRGASLPRIDMTLTGSVDWYDEIVLVLKASPVPPEQIHWYRLIGGSDYLNWNCHSGCNSYIHPLTGTFGLIEASPASSGVELVQIRWTAAPLRGDTNPTRLFIMGSGGGAPESSVLLEEDHLPPYLLKGDIPEGSPPVLEFSLSPGAFFPTWVHVRAIRDMKRD